MKHLLIASVDFLPRVGGISLMTHHLANAFVDRLGVDVTVVAPALDTPMPLEVEQHYRVVLDHDYSRGARGPLQRLALQRRHRRLFTRLLEETEADSLLLLHPFYYGAGARQACRDRCVPLGVYFHGFELRSQLLKREPFWLSVFGRWWPILSIRQDTFCTAREADLVFANSRYTAQLVHAVRKGSVHVTGCGLDQQDIARELLLSPIYDAAQRCRRRQALGLPVQATVLFLGRVVPGKNLEALIRALNHLSDVHLVVVGDGPQRRACEQLAQSLGVFERVFWAGPVSEARKWALLRAVDMLCLPSLPLPNGQVEGFGIVLLEATAAGAVVLGANAGGITDVISHRYNGLLFDPASPADLADALRDGLSGEQQMNAWLTAARQQLCERYNWAAVATRVRDAWYEATQGDRPCKGPETS